MIPAQVQTEGFTATMQGLMALGNLDGLLVTSPHKNAALALTQRVSARAQSVGAVNALRRERDGSWTGDMFDGAGFCIPAALSTGPVHGARALLFGCGGAGAAIAVELAGTWRALDARFYRSGHIPGAEQLGVSLGQHFPVARAVASRDHGRYDIVINASVVGMNDSEDLPGDPGPLDSKSIVGDVVLRPSERPTALIRKALSAGARTVTGQHMHAGQADAIMGFFHGPKRWHRCFTYIGIHHVSVRQGDNPDLE